MYRPADAFWARTDDGIRLRMAHWPASGDVRGTIFLFPGRTEFIEKYSAIANRLTAAGWHVLSLDWRGQGLSDRLQKDPRPGHVTDFADYQRDVIEMIVAAGDRDLPRPWHLLAHSMGGAIGLAALHADLPVASAVFSAPMWGLNLRPATHRVVMAMTAIAARLGYAGRAAPGTGATGTYFLDEAFSTNLLTSDVDQWARLLREAAAWPHLTIGGASYSWLAAGLRECQRLATLPAPDLPGLISVGQDEKVVSQTAIRDLAARWHGAQLLDLPGVRHEVMMEQPPARETFITRALHLFDGMA